PKPLVDPPPSVRVAAHMERFELGEMDAWWQLVYYQLELEPHSTHYHMKLEPDLTKFPGWITADDQMRSRMLKAAKKYIEEADPGTEKWLSLNMRHFPAEVGYKSLRLLQDEYPQALLTLTPE